jgi:hypothetical protein
MPPSRRVTGPDPTRRDDDERERERRLLLRDVDAGRRVWPRDVPDRELVLREPDGEDVRVAMATRLRDRHISLTCNTRGLFARFGRFAATTTAASGQK